MMKKKLSIKYIIGFVFTVAIFSYLGYKASVGIKQIVQSGVHFSPLFLLLSFLCQLLSVLLAAYLWGDIIHAFGSTSSYVFNLEAFCTSTLARKLPGTIWYAIGRIIIYKRAGQPRLAILFGILAESAILSLAGLTTGMFGLLTGPVPLKWMNSNFLRYFIILIVIISIIMIPYIIRWVTSKFQKLNANEQIVNSIVLNHFLAFRWLFFGITILLLGAGVVFFLIKSIDYRLAVPFNLILGSWGMAVAFGPIGMWLPADIGVKDGLLFLVLSPIITAPIAALVSISWRIWVSVLEIIFGFIAGIPLAKKLDLFRIHASATDLETEL
jgi:hypothetical protein